MNAQNKTDTIVIPKFTATPMVAVMNIKQVSAKIIVWPAMMLANRRIINANGLVNTPKNSTNGMIGKGRRNAAVIASMKQHGAVYFGAIGGCGALLSKCIKKAEVIAYEDLGAEALRRLEVEDFPVTVIIDALGNDLYETGRRAYLEQCNGKQPH